MGNGKHPAKNGVGKSAVRAALRTRLEHRRSELEQAALTRVYAVSDPPDEADPAYVTGIRTAISAALDYALTAVDHTEHNPPPIPPQLLVQARLAARSGVGLDTVLRRYFAGYTMFGNVLLEEADSVGILDARALKRLSRIYATLFDRLVAVVTEEYGRESERRLGTTAPRRLECVQRLLAGEIVDPAELAYDLDGAHIAVVGDGPGAEDAIRELAGALDQRLLQVQPDHSTVWAWLGARRPLDPADLERVIASSAQAQLTLAIGEPANGLAGWRLTHRQAAAALPIALRRGERFVRYADVALLASALQDDLLVTSLRQIYLSPLERDRDGGDGARKTLRAYLSADRNISSAAASLGVNRHTVAARLRAAEERIGRPIGSCVADLEVALRLAGSAQLVTRRTLDD